MARAQKQAKIKILIACHLPCHLPQGEIFVPVHGGRALKRRMHDRTAQKWLEEWTIGDDTGENISRKNGRYNEMTVIYWAWKNYAQLGNPEYIGFMHYRRHFIFGKWKKPKGGEWLFHTDCTGDSLKEFTGMSEANILEQIGNNDILYPYYPLNMNVYTHYKNSPYHKIEDLDLALSIIEDKYPDYLTFAKEYVNGKGQIFCNMFVMRREIFFEYCQWIFAVLEEYDKRRDYSALSHEEARFFISERLTGIFIHRKLAEGANGRRLPLTLLDQPYVQKPMPAFSKKNIPVVFAADDHYLPILGVALASLVNASTPENNYDILVLNEGLRRQNILALREVVKGRVNFSLRLVDVRPYFEDTERKSLFVSKDLAHISFATYYRFVIGRVFANYEKVLYLDCDLIIKEDVAKLYATDLKENWIGAAPDIRESIAIRRNIKVDGRPFGKYVLDELGLGESPYFQAGVLLYNIRRFNEDDVERRLFTKALQIIKPILMDQDILNAVCRGHVFLLQQRWNVEWQINFEFENFSNELPPACAASYAKALKKPAIIHYASPKKPWNCPPRALSNFWWSSARNTPWYEYFMYRYSDSYFPMKALKKISNTWLCKIVKLLIPVELKYKIKKYLNYA